VRGPPAPAAGGAGVVSPIPAGRGRRAKSAHPTPKAPAKSKLAKPYTLATGELVALKVSELINNFHMVQVPVLAAYDKDEDDIQIMLFGESATVDDAKQVLSAFRTKTLEAIRDLIGNLHDIQLDEEDFVLMYYDRSKNEVVLEWRDGEYKIH